MSRNTFTLQVFFTKQLNFLNLTSSAIMSGIDLENFKGGAKLWLCRSVREKGYDRGSLASILQKNHRRGGASAPGTPPNISH